MSDGPGFTTEQVIAKYIDLRDEVDAITNRAAAECAEKKKTMTLLQAWLQNKFNETGETSVKTAAGTAYVEIIKACKVSNWNALLQFIKESENWGLLKRDVVKTAVAEYMQENEGARPPGVDWTEMRDVKVRRGK